MITSKRFITTLAVICATTMLLMVFTGCGNTKSVEAGSTWKVSEITNLSRLAVAKGGAIVAPKGFSLTMTVNSVETGIEPGIYEGEIVLTPTEDILVSVTGMAKRTYHYRTGIYVSDGNYVPEKSVPSAVENGTVTDASATDVKITSAGENFNGLIISGDSEYPYSIINPVINMTGNGTNDFAGFGASIMTDGKAQVTINNASIKNTGVVRTAVWVGGNSVTTINNSEIEVHNGTLPEDYGWSWTAGKSLNGRDVMMEVPWMLGIVGNNRATTVVGNGKAYYNNTRIKAQAWGALSTDQVSPEAVLYATNCRIEVVESGYGSYADGSANTYSGCTFDVPDYGLIIARGSGHFTDGSVVNSGRFGVMSHSGSGTVTIDKGCVFNTKKAVIQIKSGKPAVTVDNSELNSECGIILEAFVNDDPNMNGPGGPGGGVPEGMRPGGAPGGPPGGPGDADNKAVTATFKNMTINGDIITSMTSESDVVVIFENAAITGAVTTAATKHATGPNGEEIVMQDNKDLYRLIGEVTHTYCTTDDEYGMKVALDGDSRWVVDENSYLTGLTIADGADITSPEGHSVTMTVDGVKKPIGAGTYSGKIVLTVTEP